MDKEAAFDHRTVLIFGRHSGDESVTSPNAIPAQIWSVLEAPPSCAINLGEHNHLLVVVEYVSSAAYGCRERPIWDEIPLDRPLLLVSNRPDRVTRRADEVDAIADSVQATGGSWPVRLPDFEHGENWTTWKGKKEDMTWKDMAVQTVRTEVKRLLELLWHTPQASAFHNRAIITINRITTRAVEGFDQLVAVRQALAAICQQRSLTRIILVIRISPTRKRQDTAGGPNSSLQRQKEILTRLLPPNIPYNVVQGNTLPEC
ncbi:putative Heterokaryon incompatibility domain-containing protein [Seiridium cardinale]